MRPEWTAHLVFALVLAAAAPVTLALWQDQSASMMLNGITAMLCG